MRRVIAIAIVIGSFVLNFAVTRSAFAVWAPSTALEAPAGNSLEKSPASQGGPILDRMERDERQLAQIVEMLKQDEREIRVLTEMSGRNPSANPSAKDESVGAPRSKH